MNYNSEWVKEVFPFFSKHNTVYLDNAASTQKPFNVLHSIREYNENSHANIHRGAYSLSVKATEKFDSARKVMSKFINAQYTDEVVFTKGTTEGINLIAFSYGIPYLNEGDEIVISRAEHHSNIVPWQQICKIKKCTLKYLPVDRSGRIIEASIDGVITNKTKIVSIASIINSLGTVQPLAAVEKEAHSHGALFIVDAAQSVSHIRTDVRSINADFLVFSGHKMYGPTGIGILYGKRHLLEKMIPYQSGGDMIEFVEELESTFAQLPNKFEAGTQNIEGAVGIAAAANFITEIGFYNIIKKERELTKYAYSKMAKLDYVEMYGDKEKDGFTPIISFNVKGIHPHDTASILDFDSIAVRSGHHCAQLLMKELNLTATCRLSISMTNSQQDIDRFIISLNKVRKVMNNECR